MLFLLLLLLLLLFLMLLLLAAVAVVVVAVALLVATTLRSLALFHFLTLPPIDLLSRLNHPETPPPQPLILFRRLSSKGGPTFRELENETKGKK